MIFITLGSQKFQFNRLLKAVDKINESDIIFAQTGYSDYTPKNYDYKNFLDREEFSEKMENADIVITHGGTGAIVEAIKRGKRVIAVPRLAQYGEHVDNHQLQIVNQFQEMGLICGCFDVAKIEDSLIEVRNKEYKKYESNTGKIIQSIRKFLEEN